MQHQVTLTLDHGSVVANPSIIGVENGDIVRFTSRDGEPDNEYEPTSAIRLDQRHDDSERITVLQAPFEYYCRLRVGGVVYGWRGGGIGLPDPPTVTAIDPSQVAQGAGQTQIIVSGTNFCNSSVGLVNGVARTTVFDSSTSIRIFLPATDFAQPGQLQIAVKNVTTSNSVTLTVTQ
jgi:hypothetical protein